MVQFCKQCRQWRIKLVHCNCTVRMTLFQYVLYRIGLGRWAKVESW